MENPTRTLTITLNISGEEETFYSCIETSEEFYKKSFKFALKMQSANEDLMDYIKHATEHVVYLFGNQFTYEHFIDSFEMEELLNESTALIYETTELLAEMNKKNKVGKEIMSVIDGGLLH